MIVKSPSGPLAILVALALACQPALAQSVKSLGDFRDWSAYTATAQSGNNLCFAMTKPSKVTPTPDGYTQGYLYLTHRPSEDITNELNFVAGYTFQPGSKATLSLGDQNFSLFTENDAAWLADPSQSDNLAGAIRAGTALSIVGTSDKGATITEAFSLAGATAASHAIDGAC
jgi:hypothetical protein